jgi:outer membrane immunogenic protein
MKKLMLASVSAVALATAAQSADLSPVMKAPVVPTWAPTWAGFYIGVDGGVVRHDASFNDLVGVDADPSGSHSTSRTGGLGGGFVGYNWQDRSFVFGLEADANWVSAKAQTTWGGQGGGFAETFPQSQVINWVATVRARAGLDFESTLLYLTGGVAFGGVNNSFAGVCGPLTGGCNGVAAGAVFSSFSQDSTRVGWTVGAGIEHMLDQHWTVRGELRYVDLGRTSVQCADVVPGSVCTGPGLNKRGEFSNTLMTGTVGVGYKF